MQGQPSFLGNFLVQEHAGQIGSKSAPIEPLKRAPLSDQLMSAILLGNRNLLAHLIAQATPSSLNDALYECSLNSNLAGLLYECCCELDLAGLLEREAPDVDANALQRFQRGAATAISRFTKLNQMFEALTGLLEDLGPKVIWLKGPVLARTLHAKPHFRLSEDFDIHVRWESRQQVLDRLTAHGYQPVWNNPGHCHQFGTGPTGSLDNLSLSPGNEFANCHNLTLMRDGWVAIELKFDPLEQGLRMKELDRFNNQSQELIYGASRLHAPNTIDHLILQLTHLHKHAFTGWQWLYDIHLLIDEINKEPSSWDEFLRRCETEGVNLSAWAGLSVVQDRLKSPVPTRVIEALAPSNVNALSRAMTYTSPTEFLWNTASLAGLVKNAMYLGDSPRKWQALHACFTPSTDFLSKYYCGGKPIQWYAYLPLLFTHWLIVLLPGGVVRRTFGRYLWTETGH